MGDRRRMRAAPLVIAMCLAYLSFGETETVEMALVSEIHESKEEVDSQVGYNRVPGLFLRNGATTSKGKDLASCRLGCTADAKCRSFSYNPKSKECLISNEALRFDPDFLMETKAKRSKVKKFRKFPGLFYRYEGWLKVTGQTLSQCEAKCASSDKCNALCYRSKDMTCLLSPKGVSFEENFTYYMKKGIQTKTMPLKKDAGPRKAPEKKKPSKAKEAKKKEDGAVKALMSAEQAKLADANKEIDRAKKMEADAKAEVNKEKAKMKGDVDKAKAKAKDKLQKDEKKFEKKEEKKLKDKTNTMKLQFASAEMKQKAAKTESKADRTKERTAKSAADVKAHAARKAARAVAEGAQEAAQRVEKATLQQKENEAAQEMNAAKQ